MTRPDDVDLTTGSGEQAASSPLLKLADSAYNLSDDRERKRGIIALSLVGILSLSVLLSFLFVFRSKTKDDIESIRAVLEIIFAPIVGLVGAVTGFYFGEKHASR